MKILGITKDDVFEINNHYLKKINWTNVNHPMDDMLQADKMEYLRQAGEVYRNPVFRQELEWLFREQIIFVSTKAQNRDQSLIGRGTINGIGLVDDRFKKLNNDLIDITKRDDEPEDEFNPLSEI